jgi:seryl-tRNA synthetase
MLKEEKLIEDLAAQLAVALKGKAKAEAEAVQYKGEKETLETKVTQLEAENAALGVERDKYKAEKEALNQKVAQLEAALAAARIDRDNYKAAKEELERKITQLEADKVSEEAERNLLRSILLDLRTHCRDGVMTLPTSRPSVLGHLCPRTYRHIQPFRPDRTGDLKTKWGVLSNGLHRVGYPYRIVPYRSFPSRFGSARTRNSERGSDSARKC